MCENVEYVSVKDFYKTITPTIKYEYFIHISQWIQMLLYNLILKVKSTIRNDANEDQLSFNNETSNTESLHEANQNNIFSSLIKPSPKILLYCYTLTTLQAFSQKLHFSNYENTNSTYCQNEGTDSCNLLTPEDNTTNNINLILDDNNYVSFVNNEYRKDSSSQTRKKYCSYLNDSKHFLSRCIIYKRYLDNLQDQLISQMVNMLRKNTTIIP